MFEYINPFFGVMLLLVIFVTLLLTFYAIGEKQAKGTNFKAPYFMYGASALLLFMLVWDATDTKHKIHNNITAFNANRALSCQAAGLKRIISKAKGWYLLDTNHFSNGDAIIANSLCEVLQIKKK
ncbi:hypothetical protein [Sulfurimonas hydrogeniphila]|uniref:hypothetical protein n=1 Tax=Sulfurimonas hydrogeniphila TaxID=2509341 RepID=UPI00125F320F|nr:hypothetical protein [Sulfurimonas hydrogeniphila]